MFIAPEVTSYSSLEGSARGGPSLRELFFTIRSRYKHSAPNGARITRHSENILASGCQPAPQYRRALLVHQAALASCARRSQLVRGRRDGVGRLPSQQRRCRSQDQSASRWTRESLSSIARHWHRHAERSEAILRMRLRAPTARPVRDRRNTKHLRQPNSRRRRLRRTKFRLVTRHEIRAAVHESVLLIQSGLLCSLRLLCRWCSRACPSTCSR